MSKTAGARAPIVGIDTLRLFAAIMVMGFHFGFKAIAESGGLLEAQLGIAPHVPGGWVLTWWGWVGVQIFFTVSGLIISYSAQSPGLTSGRFLRSRVLRLLPVVLIASVFAAVVEVLVFARDPAEVFGLWIRTVLFWPLPPWVMGQFWTLGIEVMFYALVLLLILTRRVSLLPEVGAALIFASAAYWGARVINDGADPLGRVTQLVLLQHGMYFGIGMILSARHRGGPERWHLPVLAVGLAVAALQIWFSSGWEAGYAGLQPYWPMAFAVYAASVAGCWLSMVRNDRIVARIGLGGAGVLRRLGMMTYPLYLLHNHVGKPVILAVMELGGSVALAVGLAMLLCIAAAWLVATVCEPVVYEAVRRVYDSASAALRFRLSRRGKG